MSPHHPDAEDALEQATVSLLGELGWETINAYHETFPGSILGRENAGEVILHSRLRPALERLNPGFPREAIDQPVTRRGTGEDGGARARATRWGWTALHSAACSNDSKLIELKRQGNRSWVRLRRGCLDLLSEPVERSTPSVGSSSRTFARKAAEEQGLLTAAGRYLHS